ncbi:MAG: hypothetical protein ACI9MX_003814, partial [Candidatus Aldehydirespiratoraceae bacterium]
TTTTLPPTTTSTTTTTTTTLPPTTTTQAPTDPSANLSFQEQSYEQHNGWKAKAKITFVDDDGDKLDNTDFQVTFTTAQGETRTSTYETNNKGKKNVTWGGRDWSAFPMTVTVDWVEKDGDTFIPDPATYVLDSY